MEPKVAISPDALVAARPMAWHVRSRVEAEHARRRGRRADAADDAGALPAAQVDRRVDRAVHARLQLEADGEGRHDVVEGPAFALAEREQGRQERGAQMRARRQDGVVPVEHVRGDAVEKRGVDRVGALRRADQPAFAAGAEPLSPSSRRSSSPRAVLPPPPRRASRAWRDGRHGPPHRAGGDRPDRGRTRRAGA